LVIDEGKIMPTDPFELMRSGDTSRGLRILEEGFESEPLVYDTGLGIGYLVAGEFEAAWEHFKTLIAVDVEAGRPSTTFHYGMAGVAKWCLNDPEEAVAEWREGLSCEFTDWAGGVELPLLMYFASVARPKVFPKLRAEADVVLTKRAGSHLIKNWPGAIAEFVLGRIDESALRSKCRQEDEDGTKLYNWLADFYVGVIGLVRGKQEPWRGTIRKIADVTRPDMSSPDYFLTCVWNEEFFLARHEASLLTSNA
jgi:hypothetical protein